VADDSMWFHRWLPAFHRSNAVSWNVVPCNISVHILFLLVWYGCFVLCSVFISSLKETFVKHLCFFQDVVPWRKSRCILYWRLRRLLLENQIKIQMLTIQPNLSVGQAEAMLTRWFLEDKGTTAVSLFDIHRFIIVLVLHVTTFS